MSHSRTAVLVIFVLSVAVLAMPATAIERPNPDRAPLILSAHVEGGELLIQGAGLTAGDGTPPVVALSGELLDVRPGFSDHQVRARLSQMPPGSYLLTVARGADAAQAGVLAVTLAAEGRVPDPVRADPEDGILYLCANQRHLRLVDDPDDCGQNESAIEVSGQFSSSDGTSDDGEDEADSDGDADADGDADEDSDEASDSEEEEDKGKKGKKGKKNKGKGKGGGG